METNDNMIVSGVATKEQSDKLICPNCGAESEYGGVCEYCGSPLTDSSSLITVKEDSQSSQQLKHTYFVVPAYIDKGVSLSINSKILPDGDLISNFYFRIPASIASVVNVCGLSYYNLNRLSTAEQVGFYELMPKTGQEYRIGDFYPGRPASLSFSANNKQYKVLPSSIKKTKKTITEHVKDISLDCEYEEWEADFKVNTHILKFLCESKYCDIEILFDDCHSLSYSTYDRSDRKKILLDLLLCPSRTREENISLIVDEIQKYLSITEVSRLIFNSLYDDTEYAETKISIRNEAEEIYNRINQKREKEERKQKEKKEKCSRLLKAVEDEEKKRKLLLKYGWSGIVVSIILVALIIPMIIYTNIDAAFFICAFVIPVNILISSGVLTYMADGYKYELKERKELAQKGEVVMRFWNYRGYKEYKNLDDSYLKKFKISFVSSLLLSAIWPYACIRCGDYGYMFSLYFLCTLGIVSMFFPCIYLCLLFWNSKYHYGK